MKRPEYRIRKAQVGKWEYWCIWIPAKVAGNSKGSRRYFRTKAEAVAARAAYLNAAAGDTDEAPPDELVADATEARRVLDKAGIKLPLAEVARRAVTHLTLPAAGLPVRRFLDQYRETKWEHWGELSRRNWALDSKRMLAEFDGCQLADVTPARLETWLAGWTPGSRKSIISNLRPAFNYAVRRGYLESSPFERLEAVKVAKRPIAIYTPGQARAMLAAIRPESRAGLAIMLFAGVRPHEVLKLRWADVREGYIHVKDEVAKTRQARNIAIHPCLAAWLDAVGRGADADRICPAKRAFEGDIRAVKADAGVTSRQPDMARHSFASYWLAAYHDEAKLKGLMGHSVGSDTLFVHYRAAATEETAAEYWAIYPSPPEK